jgi:hypothetical protein
MGQKDRHRCDTEAYKPTGKEINEDDMTLDYGSAKLKGKLF